MPPHEPMGVKVARKLAAVGGCIEWVGARRPNGYGVIGWVEQGSAKYDSAHRIVYELTKGAIPAGLHIDHLCRNRACVHPGHLEAVTQAENNRRSNALRFHGHAHPAPPADQWVTLTLGELVALIGGNRDHLQGEA